MDEIRKIIENVIEEFGTADEAIRELEKVKDKIPEKLHRAMIAYMRVLELYIERSK